MRYTGFIISFIIFLTSASFAQNYVLQKEIGKFKNASAFYMNEAGIIYVTDSNTDEVYKLDTLGKVLKYTGGYGWNSGEFDNPVNIFATALDVYVCDKNNNRIQRFDKDLNYVSQIYTRESDNQEERFGYPLSVATSNQGDLFILDSENRRIIKFDLLGNFISNFGGFDAGAYALSNPLCFAISKQNNIYVIDGKRLVVFDQYGNGVAKFNTDLNFKKINIIFNNLTVNTNNEIYCSSLTDQFSLSKISLEDTNQNNDIVSSLIFGNKLYVLTPKEILIFRKV